MTATRDRRSDLDTEPGPASWGDAPAFGSRAMPWWGAVLTALALTAVGALFDELTSKTLGLPFQVLYTIGCVLAVTFVRRRSLFGPMVQPPLIMIIVAGVVLALFAAGASGGLAAKALAVGPALIGNFPVMAIATVLTVVIGAVRLILQRKPRPGDDDFPPPVRSVRRDTAGRDDRDPVGRDREPPRREPAPRPAGARSRPTPPPGRDRERMDRDRQQPPPPQRQVPPGRGGAPGGRPAAPGAGGQRGGMPPRPAAPGRGGNAGGGRPAGGQGRPPQPPPRRPRRPDDEY